MVTMNQIINPSIDRSKWGPGAWNEEPDKVQWIDPKTDLDCLAVRNPSLGNWCGYVGVAPGHRMHGVEYDGVDAEVHGGLTFSGPCREGSEFGICHVPEPGRHSDIWWLGFDCAHYGDLSPGMKELGFCSGEQYRQLGYVKSECESLAAQIL